MSRMCIHHGIISQQFSAYDLWYCAAGRDLTKSLHILEFRLLSPSSPLSLAAVTCKMVSHSGIGLPRLSWKLAMKTSVASSHLVYTPWHSSRVLDLRATCCLRVEIPATPLSNCYPGQAVNTHVPLSLTKRYNLVSANGRWCHAAGKLTVGLTSHWPHVTDISGSPSTGSRLRST